MFHRVKSEPPAQQKPTPATQTAPASQAQPSQHGTPHQEQPAEAARATQQQSSKPQPETAQDAGRLIDALTKSNTPKKEEAQPMTDQNKKVKVTIQNPKQPVDSAAVNSAMDLIVSKQAFLYTQGRIVSKVGADQVQTETSSIS